MGIILVLFRGSVETSANLLNIWRIVGCTSVWRDWLHLRDQGDPVWAQSYWFLLIYKILINIWRLKLVTSQLHQPIYTFIYYI